MQAPLVSVVIPSYNHRKFIGEAIRSVLAQTYENIECLIIDDGSNDQSFEIIQDIIGNDRRVTAFRRDNSGAHATINEAIQRASGNFISILNSDDTYDPTRIERLVSAAQFAPQSFFGITGVRFVNEHGGSVAADDPHQRYYECVRDAARNKPDPCGLWVGNIAITTSNFFFSSDIFAKVGTFKPLRYAHDWDWALRASSLFGITRIKDDLVSYRKHGGNTIDEVSPLRHLAEDAYVWATALNSVRRGHGSSTLVPTERLFECILENVAFPLLPTLYLMASARTDDELLTAIEDGTLEMELETIRQINSITPQFPDSLRTILHSIGDLRTKNHALGQEVEQLKAGQLEPTTGPKPSAAAETPALTASNAQRSRFAHIFGSLFRRKQHGDDRGTAPNIHAPTSAESARDHIEVTELRYDGSDEPQTLLYAEGPALERIHFYRTRDRFVFTIWHFDPGRRRQILTGATAARSLPIILFARFMKVKPERSNVDFLQHIGMRGVLLHTEPFDHHSAEALRGRRIYGETLEYLTYNKDPNKLVGKVLDSLPIPEIVAMLAENNISVERAGNILAMTYAGFENETAKIRVKSQSTQRRNDLDAADERGDLRIYSISPTRTGGAVA